MIRHSVHVRDYWYPLWSIVTSTPWHSERDEHKQVEKESYEQQYVVPLCPVRREREVHTNTTTIITILRKLDQPSSEPVLVQSPLCREDNSNTHSKRVHYIILT